MQVTKARYKLVQGLYPVLELTINGQLVRVDYEHHPEVLKAGYVFIGDQFEDTERELVEIQAPSGPLPGYTRDRKVVELYKNFLEAAGSLDYKPGLVEIPK